MKTKFTAKNCAICTKLLIALDAQTIVSGCCGSCRSSKRYLYGHQTSAKIDWGKAKIALYTIFPRLESKLEKIWGQPNQEKNAADVLLSQIAVEQTGKDVLLMATAVDFLGFSAIGNAILRRFKARHVKVVKDTTQQVFAVTTDFSRAWNFHASQAEWKFHGEESKGKNYAGPFQHTDGRLLANVRAIPFKDEVLMRQKLCEVYGDNVILHVEDDAGTVISLIE